MTSARVDAAPTSASNTTRVRRFCLQCRYDGGKFRGFAENDGVRTVGGELRQHLEKILQQPISLTCSGRTDAGVHAWSQYVTFDVVAHNEELPDSAASRIHQSLSRMVAPHIGILGVREVPITFDARFSATWRAYRYLIAQEHVTHPFIDSYVWRVGHTLDVEAMAQASIDLLGEQDFTSFCRKVKSNPQASLVRRLLHITVTQLAVDQQVSAGVSSHGAPLLAVDLVGSAFCHQMVRSIVGLLVDIGLHRRTADAIPAILEAQDRNASGGVAPPHGLHLVGVGFNAPYPSSLDPIQNLNVDFTWDWSFV